MVYNVAAILQLQGMVHVVLLFVINILHFHISTSTLRSMCGLPTMAVFCSYFILCFPRMFLRYFLNYFEMSSTVTEFWYLSHRRESE